MSGFVQFRHSAVSGWKENRRRNGSIVSARELTETICRIGRHRPGQRTRPPPDVPLDYLLADYFSDGDYIEIHDDYQLRESREVDPDFFSVIFSEFLNSAPAEEMLHCAWERAFDVFWRKTGLSFQQERRQVRALLHGTFYLQYGRRRPDEWCQLLAHEFQKQWDVLSEGIMKQWRATYSGENAEPMLWFSD